MFDYRTGMVYNRCREKGAPVVQTEAPHSRHQEVNHNAHRD
jgi:hypothetical protein